MRYEELVPLSDPTVRMPYRPPLPLFGFLLAVGLILQPGLSSADSGSATRIVTGARIWTGVAQRPWATGLAVRNATILAIGDDDQVERLADPETIRIDGRGKMITPGLVDSHVHFLDGGLELSGVQLRDAGSRAEFVRRIAAFAAQLRPGQWITGGNWDHTLWGGTLPQCNWIDAVTSRNPVWIQRLDGHMALANSAALRAAGITRETADVEGGTIVRDGSGQPTGILKDNAMAAVSRVVPRPSNAQLDSALTAAMAYVAARGVTSVHHMGSWVDLAVFRRAHRAGRLRTRIYAAVPLATWQRLAKTVTDEGHGDEWLRIGGLKGFVDGSLGSHTAALLDPYTDVATDRGLLVNSREDLYRWTAAADRVGLQVMVHAIGDRANRMQLDIFQQVAAENGPRDRRFRIEHAQHLAPTDIPRFGALGVIASMQPYHLIDDGRWAEPLIGPRRAATTYAFRQLLDNGARLAFGSDWFVAPPTPLAGIYAAVTRRTLDGKRPEGWVPAQKITVEEALRAYTATAAYASFEEDLKGTLEPGKLADFVILDRDLTQVPPTEIRGVRVVATYVGGRAVFQGKGFGIANAKLGTGSHEPCKIDQP
jgi:predicted amidohydrolase YtcJ